MSDASVRPFLRALASVTFAVGAGASCAPAQSVNRGVVEFLDGGPPDGGTKPDGASPLLLEGGIAPVDTPPAPADKPAPPTDSAAPEVLADRPAAAPATDAAVLPGALVVTSTNPGSAVTDLTTAGPLDWAHFGFQGTTGINRKRGTTAPLILMALLGSNFVGRSAAGFSQFIWSDGTPVVAARNVLSGFETNNAAAGGFQISVQGDPQRPRTVGLFVGSAQGGARLTARFGTFGAPVYMDQTLTAATVDRNRLYTIVFQPSVQEPTLVLEWTIDGAMGSVRLQAVTLAESPRAVAAQ
jgi:hypothetical protein